MGAMLSHHVPHRLKKHLPDTFGLSAILMGISLMQGMEQMVAVVLALIVGTAAGELLHLESGLTRGLHAIGSKFPAIFNSESADGLISLIVLFSFSGTGIFGAMNEAMTGDHTILLSKSILDFFTAVIFGTTMGYAVALVALPQMIVGLVLFLGASQILPMVSAVMLADFKACGGVITLAAGLKIAKLKEFRVFNMLPALILILFASALCSSVL